MSPVRVAPRNRSRSKARTGPSLSAEPIFAVYLPGSMPSLLRHVMQSHRDVICPAGLHLAAPLREYLRITEALCAGHSSSVDSESMRQRLRREAVESVERRIRLLSPDRRKRVWCAMSPDIIDNLSTFEAFYPRGRFVCVNRDAMDFIYASIQSLKRGFSGASYEHCVVRRSKINGIQSLAGFWCNQMRVIAEFEKSHPARCFQVRYESIVFEPRESLAKLFAFLGLRGVEGALQEVFAANNGSEAADWVRAFHERERLGVGRGRELAVDGIDAGTMAEMNSLLRERGYDVVGEDWNTKTPTHLMYGAGDDLAASYAARKLDELFGMRIPRLLRKIPKELSGKLLRICIKDIADATWLIDFDNAVCVRRDVRNGADCTVTAGFDTIVKLLNGELNLTMAVASGAIHCRGDGEFFRKAWRLFS